MTQKEAPDPRSFAERCPYCNAEAEVVEGELYCWDCGAGTEKGVWVEGYL